MSGVPEGGPGGGFMAKPQHSALRAHVTNPFLRHRYGSYRPVPVIVSIPLRKPHIQGFLKF